MLYREMIAMRLTLARQVTSTSRDLISSHYERKWTVEIVVKHGMKGRAGTIVENRRPSNSDLLERWTTWIRSLLERFSEADGRFLLRGEPVFDVEGPTCKLMMNLAFLP